ncbi:MAG: CehA/McbA family metallohydrolase [Polyangiales bacterium]
MPSALLHQRGDTRATDSKTVKALSFDVPQGVEALTLRFDYQPRTTSDEAKNKALLQAAFEIHTERRKSLLSSDELAKHREALGVERRAKCLDNLMNVVLVDPNGQWRGRWDRNPSSNDGALVLAEAHASRGFLPGEIQPGTWTAAIECHGVFGEPVSWEIAVEAREPLTDDEIDRLRSRAVATKDRKRRGAGWYFGEMHSHTVHSDGKWEIEELASKVRANGSDFLCLTDHNTMSGHEEPPELPLTLIRGSELTTFHGHHPIYGLKDMVPWHEGGRVLPLKEVAPRVRAQNGLVSIAHPFVPGDPLCTGCRMPKDLDPEDFDSMELGDRRWLSPGADNVAAYNLWNDYWRRGHRIVGVGARDVHGPDQEGSFPGEMPLTGVFAEDNTPSAILEGLRRGRVIVSGGPIVELALSVGGGAPARIGESIRGDVDAAEVTISNLDAPAELRLLDKGEVIERTDVAADGTETFALTGRGPGWYRAELWAGDVPRTITNHVIWEEA